MSGKPIKLREGRRHVSYALFVNLVAVFISTIAYFSIVYLLGKVTADQSKANLIASICAIVFWCISYGLVVFLIRRGQPHKKYLKYLGYYFPPTTLFVLLFDQRNLRLKAEEKLRRLEMIVDGWPEVRIIAKITDPEIQRQTLSNIIDEIDDMKDHILAQVLDIIWRYADDILASVRGNVNYDLFRQLMEKVSHSEPDARPETYAYFLWLLSDIFSMPPKGCFTRKVQQDMIGPLRNAISRVDRSHLSRMGTIIAQIMADEEDQHHLARQILEMLLHLDCNEMREVCQIIFDESKKRAFRFPQDFGLDFLITLGQLEHKVFWLDIQSFRDILEQALQNGERGLINLKSKAYNELCSKVFASLEDEEHPSIHGSRVFRRLKGKDGSVLVKCLLPHGGECTCEGESLSFRGFYSKKCVLKVGERMKSKVIPSLEIRQPKPKHEFILMASVAKLHPAEDGTQRLGRGVFFEDAEEDVVKGLYQYISEHRK